MAAKKLAPIRVTEAQREWLEMEFARTGNTFAVLVRTLIDAEMRRQNHESTKAALSPRHEVDS